MSTPSTALRRATARGARPDASALARRLASAVQWPSAFELGERAWRLLARSDDFDAWLIAWPPGGKVELHDHGESAGALSVVTGSLVEAAPRRDETGRLSLERHELRAGTTLGFGVGHVHDVINESCAHALSVHVYSPALTTMTFYDLAGDRLVARAERWCADGPDEELSWELAPAPDPWPPVPDRPAALVASS